MDRRDLYAYDRVLAKYLSKKNLSEELKKSIYEDYGCVMHGG
jgi:hypothetical protein